MLYGLRSSLGAISILEALDQIFQLTTYVIRERSMAEDDDQRGTKFFVSPSSLPLFKDCISDWTEKVSLDIHCKYL